MCAGQAPVLDLHPYSTAHSQHDSSPFICFPEPLPSAVLCHPPLALFFSTAASVEALKPVNTCEVHGGSPLLAMEQKHEVTKSSCKQLSWEAHIFTDCFFCSRVKAISFPPG